MLWVENVFFMGKMNPRVRQLIFSIMTAVKINIDKVSLKVFFKTMAKINENMNETSFVHFITKCRLQIKAQVTQSTV